MSHALKLASLGAVLTACGGQPAPELQKPILSATSASAQAAAPEPNASDSAPVSAPTPAAGSSSAPRHHEVRGRLVWREPRYRLIVPPRGPAGKEVVLDIWISEDKVLARELDDLRDKEVIVTGDIVRVPKASVVITSDADYTSGFTNLQVRRAK
jgi:hypothetical protein